MNSVAPNPQVPCDSPVEPLDLNQIFGRTAPLHVDLGCGDGSFLCELAAKSPAKNFLGIDRQRRRVTQTSRKAAPLENIRVLNAEISYAVRYLLPPGSVETFYLFFPDPWPKRRHHRRRLVTAEFLDAIHQALEPGGRLKVATDHLEYFQHIQRVAAAAAGFQAVDPAVLDLPVTKFERRFRTKGAPIYRLTLRKVSPVT